KIKIQPGDISKTIHLIQKLSHKLGSDHQYRLDVNGGWNIDEAFQNANLLYGLPIDYIEQPLPPDQLDELSHLSKDIKIPIAVDESLTSFNSAKEIIRKQAAGVFIIKPMVTGSFSEIRDIVNLAKANQIRCVFSSSLELEVGRMAIIHLAAVNHITEPCGLDTGYLFTKSPASLPEIRNGKIQIPDEIGLGISSSHLRELF
ncbi:MAG: mandelate racemase/muconate lactonizing enzyme family protein, partial [Fidelibacterota bacterium]